jgi:phosphoribosyl-ATP pyrophosphohydrolase
MRSTLYELEDLLRERKVLRPSDSYSTELFEDRERIQRKIMEEAFETCLEFGRPDRNHERIVSEAADLLFHLLVGLVDCDVSFDEVIDELERRRK